MPEALKRITASTVVFGDVVQLSKERSKDPQADGFERYVGLEHLEPSDLKIRSWGDIADGTTFTNVFRPGQVLFGKRRAYQRKVAVSDFSGVCSGDIYVLEPKGDHLLPELLPFICQSEPFYDYVISMSQGGLSPRVNWKALAKYEFALPPLEEQRRIAEVLQASDRHREAILQSLGCARNVRKSLADNLLSLNIDAMHQRKIGDLVLDSAYGPRFPSEKYTSEGNAWTVRTTDFEGHCGIDLTTVPSALLADDVVAEHRLQNGDFLLSRSGEYAGTVRVFDGSAAPDRAFIPAAFLIRFRLDTSQILPEYLFEYCDSPIGRRQLSSIARGSAQPNISGSGFMNLKIDVPALAAQSNLCAKIRAARQAESMLEVRTSAARTTAKAIASSVFGP